MSGSGAGLAASTARPDWQVDIPSLSRLLLSAGSQGLKQLANDGVDPHTLGCMLMIAEYTPASEEFRRALTETRQRQRSGKSLWLYKVIEIGASTNFIADQLLKTRAGENVIALLSATASFTSDSTTTSIISALFELAKVPLNDTPGTAQIAQFRKALMPLVLKLGFKEKLFYHHYYFQGLKGEVNSAANVMEAIPSVKSLSKLIPMIYRVATSKEGHVLACHGFAGAAWIATYSSYILGLNVTAIDAEGRTHQIYYGPYEDARIIIDLSKQISPETANCGLYINGNPQDFFCVKPDPIPSGWTIDCSMLNLLETRLPGIMDCEDLRLISACAAIETMNRVSRMAELFVRCCPIETNRGHWLGLRPLNLHVLPNLQDRSLRILEIFGFCPGPRDRYEFMAHLHCPAYLCTGLRNDGRPTEEGRSVRLCKELAPPVLQSLHKSNPVYEKYCHVATAHSSIDSNSVLKSLKDFVGGISPSEGPSRSKSHRGSSTSFRDLFKDWQSTMQMDLANLISALVHCAATLAFTDWDESLQQLSVRATIACRKADWGGWISRRDSHTWFFDEHIRKILDVCIDNSNRQRNNLQDLPQSWIASELDGTAVMRKHAIEASLAKLDGHFLRLRPGLIRFEGSSCTSIQAVDAFRGLDLGDVRHGGAVAQSSKIITGPCNIADKILMQSLCHREGSIIWVRSEVCLSESVRKIDLVRICKGIPHLKASHLYVLGRFVVKLTKVCLLSGSARITSPSRTRTGRAHMKSLLPIYTINSRTTTA
ncbi:hypothetical protein EV356DRAFT_360543 [Viridothelium virens]|uniref:Uncharacterized protein n=1 Tax=Viridothelium virens TaxID=1048519 RepID=A0A6A6HI82_VIRVR|nr:hypothetical protein EV356DRAFT_360543 [Viridothelium virens]